MGYHAINHGSTINVYSRSSCLETLVIGHIYNGEVLTITDAYFGNVIHEIRFRNSSGQYVGGFIDHNTYGNLAFYGSSDTLNGVSCYRFKLRNPLQVVSTSGTLADVLTPGDFVYTTSATAGQSNLANMYIIGYKKKYDPARVYNGFVTLDYTCGSMFYSNFCLEKG